MIRAAVVAVAVFAALAAAPTRGAEAPGGIEGVVTGDGKPVAGALVAAVPTPQAEDVVATARTDAQGRFHLAPLRPGRYGVTATAKDRTAGFTADVVVGAGVARASIALDGDSITLRGVIVDDGSGAPIEGARLTAGRISDFEGDLFAIDAPHGAFEVRLPRATYVLRARATGHAPLARTLRPELSAPLTFRLDPAWPAGPAPSAVIGWLRANAIPLASVEPHHGFADLQLLGSIIGGARVVGLGEATHATREFFQLKHRLLEWLVSERGFTVFAIEATLPEALDLNDYVLTGRGDPHQLLVGLHFWVWDTEEVLDLVRWMRTWNENPAHPRVKFYGFDMQYAPRALEGVTRYLRRVAPADTARLIAPLTPLRYELDAQELSVLSSDERSKLGRAAQAIVDLLDADRVPWSAHSSADEWAVARQQARVLVQYIASRAPEAGTEGARDAFMAENLQWIADHEHAKVVAWAHNLHVGHTDDGFPSMGEHLRRALGSGYLALGMAFDHGSFGARDFENDDRRREFTVAPMPAGSLDGTLAATGIPRFLIDLRKAPPTVAGWLRSEHGTRYVGSSFSPRWPVATVGWPMAVGRAYDALAFVAEATASQSLPEGLTGDHIFQPALVNTDFEDVDGKQLQGWNSKSRVYSFSASATAPFHGRHCGLLKRSTTPTHDYEYGVFEQHVDVRTFRGRRLHLTAAVRARVPRGASARLYVLVEKGWEYVAVETMRARPITSSGWHEYEIEVPIPKDATSMYVGGALMGHGSVCFDDLRLRGDEMPRSGLTADPP